jgi:hypothetical protein
MLGHMTRAQKILDFIFGVALISGAPAITFLFLSFIMSWFVFHSAWWWAEQHPLLPVAFLILWASVLTAFISVCIWRKKHKRLPASTFVAEVTVAVFVAVFFIIFFIAGEHSAYHAEWS